MAMVAACIVALNRASILKRRLWSDISAGVVGFSLFLGVFLTAPVEAAQPEAGLPAGAEAMLEAAAATGDRHTFQIVLATALSAWPEARLPLLEKAQAANAAFVNPQQEAEVAEARTAAAHAEAVDKARGLAYTLDPKLWNAQIELGAGANTGDSAEKALTLGLSVERVFSSVWEHKLDVKLDYARRDGVTTQKRLISDYDLLWKAWEKGYVQNFTRLEFDQNSNYDYRLIENIGLGYHLLEITDHSLRLEAGPGVRYSGIRGTGETDTELMGRVASSYIWQINADMTFTDRAAVLFGSTSTTLENYAEVAARINASMAAKISFEIKYDSASTAPYNAWDTITRASFVYDF